MTEATLEIMRRDPEKEKQGHFEKYTVPVVKGMVVLDAVRYVQSTIDGTLAIRWNCKAGRCGSCAAEINGKPMLMCKYLIPENDASIRIEPMKAFPLIKDLVTDVSGMWDIARTIPSFRPRKTHEMPWKIYQQDVDKALEFRKCIECFICQDVCHVIREHKGGYVGPRYMVKIASLDMHPMDAEDRTEFLHKSAGIGLCNITKCCQELCPEHITITDNAIIPEKERVVDRYFDPLVSLIRKIRGHAKS